ncbi:hypothetical protein L208DRAFT_1414824 [Tricholoma matsutake]|nr:hypothetical protein L208DRAFT_1414824 [Tricholoma matsutake 945]
MPDDTVRVLRCLVKGATIPMKVSLSVDDDVDDLKAMVHQRGQNLILRGTDIQDLFVWKLNNQEFIIPEESLGDRVFSQGHLSTIAVKLESSARIGHIFKDQPKLGLHIVVQHVPSPTISPSSSLAHASSTGERPPAAQKLPSEHSLHKLWMLAKEPQAMLFETRPVQRDEISPSTETNLPLDCMVLKGGDWVRELQPDSRFTGVLIRAEYKEALRAIMEWFLHGNKVTEDPMEVDDMQPAPLGNPFLDVPIGLVSENWAFVLLGNPGIGKTAFLYVLLVLRLQARLPTIYQSRDTYLYYFADNGVFRIHLPGLVATNFKSQFYPSTWCLIDSNQSLDTVPVFIQDLDLFIVQASSPRPRFEWMDKATSPVLRYFMKSWTLSELLVGYVTLISEPFVIPLSRALQRKVCSEAQIEFFSNRYGTSARSVYRHASRPSDYDITLLGKLTSITYERLDSLIRQSSALDLSGPVSHQIIILSPGSSRKAFESTFPTRYIYEKLRDRLFNHKLEAVARLYDIFVRNKVPAGFMLEDAVNDVFFRGGEWSLVNMMKSNHMGPKYTHWKDPKGPISPQYLHLGYMGRHIAIDTNPNPVGTVYVPLPLVHFLTGAQLQLKDGYYYPSSRS